MVDVVESSPLFMRLLNHLTKSLSRLLPLPDPASAEALELARDVEEERLYLDESAVYVPLDTHRQRLAMSLSEADVLQLQRDLASAPEADRALGAIMAAARRDAAATRAEATNTASPWHDGSEKGYLSQAILAQLTDLQPTAHYAERELLPEGLAGLTRPSDWLFAGAVLRDVVERFRSGTDHGLVGTIVEEMYRTIYAEKVGRFLWDNMKTNAEHAYDPLNSETRDNPPGGTLFLQLLQEYQVQHGPVESNLIGHSAGSIHISHFIARAAQMDPDHFRTNCIIFLAPACNFATFHAKLIPHASRINKFRIYTMADTYERRDPLIKLLPVAYPHSLLYLVSGLFEDVPDTPLIGLARHLQGEYVPLLPQVRSFLQQFEPPAVVYSKTADNAPPGEQAGFTSHYGIWGPDFDRATLASVASLIHPNDVLGFSAMG